MANPQRRIDMPRFTQPKSGGVRLVPVQDLRDLHKLLLLMVGLQFIALAFQVASSATG